VVSLAHEFGVFVIHDFALLQIVLATRQGVAAVAVTAESQASN
jgi:hypothetical protein